MRGALLLHAQRCCWTARTRFAVQWHPSFSAASECMSLTAGLQTESICCPHGTRCAAVITTFNVQAQRVQGVPESVWQQ
jgi:hypothetical protein